mgnify:CR=1 FL=1
MKVVGRSVRHAPTAGVVPKIAGATVAQIESCAPAPEGPPERFVCTLVMAEPEGLSAGNQDLQVSISLRDAAQNAVEIPLDTIRYSPAPPASFTATSPEEYYTLESCQVFIEVTIPDAVLDTVEIPLAEQAGLSCPLDLEEVFDEHTIFRMVDPAFLEVEQGSEILSLKFINH